MNTLANTTDDGMNNDKAVLDGHGMASATLTLSWSDDRTLHEEQLHMEKFSVWREADLLPPDIALKIPGMQAGDQAQATLKPGEVIGTWKPARQISTHPSRFKRHHRSGLKVEPRLGRFYPQAFFQGVRGIFKDAAEPARITELTRERLDIDTNQPLARYPLQVQFRLDQVIPGYDWRGGRCSSPLDDLLRYPGLAACLADGRDTDYGENTGSGMSRMDERQDGAFYDQPRLVQHLDARALETVNALYCRLIPKQAEVLDLMASFDSHLQGVSTGTLHVLGMNSGELAANDAATERIVQDLNASPTLPHETRSLDAIVCTASIEYLVRPAEVLAEALRILRPGGIFVITFSNRWFPGKAIRIWSEMHEYERVGMINQWLYQAGYTALRTFSSRGWPRPADDRYAGQTPYSDPVYAVWGAKPED